MRGRLGKDGIDIIDKSHAEHLIGLIEDNGFDCRKISTAALKVIEHATRRCNHDVHTFFERPQLLTHIGAAAESRHLQALYV